MALIARSQVITATGGSISSLNAVFSSAVTAGNTVVVHFTIGGTGVGVLAINPTDNVNAGAYSTSASTYGFIAGSSAGAGIYHKLAISSGAGASTYRVRLDAFGVNGFASMAAFEYSNIGSYDQGGSTVGTSSSPTSPSLTASGVGNLFSHAAGLFSASTLTARSTGSPTGMTVTITDQNNNNQMLISGESINTSSLTVQPITRVSVSTLWAALSAVFIASTTAGGGGRGYWPGLSLVGAMEKTL